MLQQANPTCNLTGRTATLWFFGFAEFWTLLWAVLPGLIHHGYRPDVVELQFIGPEWVLATRKHPMLPAWILESINIVTGRAFVAPFIASQLCVLLTLWSVWSLGRKVLSERLALVGTFAMLPYWFFTVESIKYNQNTVLTAFWTFAIFLLFQAIQTNRTIYWFGTGVALGLAFQSKYSTVFLVAAMLLFLLSHSKTRSFWKKPGPYITALVAFLIFLPHLIWLWQDNFETLQYARMQNAGKEADLWSHVLAPFQFIVCELGYLICSMVILIPCLGWKWHKKSLSDDHVVAGRQLLLFCIGVPFVMHIVLALFAGKSLNADYGASFWPFSGILLLLCFRASDDSRSFGSVVRRACFFELVMVAVLLGQSLLSPYITNSARRFHFPMQSLGAECDRIWSSRFAAPCPYVSGDWWCAGNAAITMKDRPSVHFYWNNIDKENIKPTGTWSEDTDVNAHGGLILWPLPEGDTPENNEHDPMVPEYIDRRFPAANDQKEILVLPYNTGAPIAPLRIGVAVIPPPE